MSSLELVGLASLMQRSRGLPETADNAEASDEHRALNYLAVVYPAMYANAAQAFAERTNVDEHSEC